MTMLVRNPSGVQLVVLQELCDKAVYGGSQCNLVSCFDGSACLLLADPNVIKRK